MSTAPKLYAVDGGDQPEAFGADKAKSARYYIGQLEASIKYWAPYQKRCERILTRYEDDREKETKRRKFAIFWSNIETLKPLCYTKQPDPLITRRYKDSDPVARVASEVLERAVSYTNDAYDYDQVLKDCRDEFLILAKGQSWVRYVPTFEDAPQVEGVTAGDVATKQTTDAGEEVAKAPPQRLKYECVVSDHVSYEDWGTNKARKWAEVWLVWRRVYMTRDALEKRFGKEIGGRVPLDWKEEGVEANEDTGQAMVYELWDKRAKKAIWISRSFPMAPLDERDDPLGLEDFFPCQKPAMGTTSPRKIIPIPDYVQYQDQAEEVDELTGRISKITEALRVVGVYAGDANDALQNMFKPGNDNKVIPIDGWTAFKERGGVKGLIEWAPIDMILLALKGLYEARENAISVIYQICAIPDIMRGDSEAEETATAQGLKSTWGSSRVKEKQKEMARFARDDMRLKGELISKKFSIKTLQQMTNIQLLTRAEKQQYEAMQAAYAQQAAMMAQAGPPQPGMPAPPQPQPPPIPPDRLALMNQPTWEDVDELLKSDHVRLFRIDIEADSTVEPDLMKEQTRASEFITALGTYLTNSLPVVQAAKPMGKLVAEGAKFLSRKFNAGREMEAVIEETVDAIANQPDEGPNPDTVKAQADMAKAQQEAEKHKGDLAKVQADLENTRMEGQRAQLEARSAELDRIAKERDDQWSAKQTAMREQNDADKIALERDKHNDMMDLEREKLDLKRRELDQNDRKLEHDQATRAEDMEHKRTQAAYQQEREHASREAEKAEPPERPEREDRQSDAIGMGLQALAAALSKPKTLVRGPDGKATGIE